MHKTLCALIVALLFPTGVVHADITEAVKTAMQSELRTDAETARDANRKPAETLAFFRLEPDMRVLELIPGGGWYTKLLAPVLAEEGKLFVAVGTQGIANMQAEGQLSEVEILEFDGSNIVRTPGERRIGVKALDLSVKNIDLALTFRNLHNLNADGRKAMNEGVFKTLKRGGLYGIIDHTRRHMQSDSSENWRRLDPVQVIKEVEAAGFEFVDYSDLHYRYDDELRYEVGRKSVAGNTDRFTLLFEKP